MRTIFSSTCFALLKSTLNAYDIKPDSTCSVENDDILLDDSQETEISQDSSPPAEPVFLLNSTNERQLAFQDFFKILKFSFYQ